MCPVDVTSGTTTDQYLGSFTLRGSTAQLKSNSATFPELWFQQSWQHTCHIQQGDRTGLSLFQTS